MNTPCPPIRLHPELMRFVLEVDDSSFDGLGPLEEFHDCTAGLTGTYYDTAKDREKDKDPPA